METQRENIDFSKLDLPIPELINSYNEEKQREIFEYLNSLDELQKKAYLIAKSHLGTSFNIYKSNGFKDWIKNKK